MNRLALRRLLCCPLAALCAAALAAASSARADVFLLHNEGQVRGQLVNTDQSPRQTYEVLTPGGGRITLEATQVKRVVPQRPEEMEYDRLRLKAPDTIDGQWKMSEWCRENHLSQQRRAHLERIIELDPNHEAARRGLGYSHIRGQWMTQKEKMEKDGYIFYGGKWILPQERDLYEQHHKEDLAQKEWYKNLKMWREWIEKPNKAEQGRARIAAIGKSEGDVYAVKALAAYMHDEIDREIKIMYIEALSRIGTPAAMDALARASLNDTDEEIRVECLEQVVKRNYRPAIGLYVQTLKSKDNVMVNRAGACLRQMKEPSTIGPLIDALVTTHKFQIQPVNPGQTSATFGTGPNAGAMPGFSFGNPAPQIVTQKISNQAVLDALVSLTAPTNFEFDTIAWRQWFAAQKKPATMDARRD